MRPYQDGRTHPPKVSQSCKSTSKSRPSPSYTSSNRLHQKQGNRRPSPRNTQGEQRYPKALRLESCLRHRPPNGEHGIAVLDDETMTWLSSMSCRYDEETKAANEKRRRSSIKILCFRLTSLFLIPYCCFKVKRNFHACVSEKK